MIAYLDEHWYTMEGTANLPLLSLLVKLTRALEERATVSRRDHSVEFQSAMVVLRNLFQVQLDNLITGNRAICEKSLQLHRRESQQVHYE